MRVNNVYNQYNTATKNQTNTINKSDVIKNTYKADPTTSTRSTGLVIDKGTAIETTIHVNRGDYDKIVNAAINSKTTPLEIGKDMNKRWIVIDGQRFECELSPEEKAAMREGSKTLIDYYVESLKELEKQKEDDNSITASDNIKSEYMKKRYGSADATPDSNDVVLQILKQAGLF